ncbi:MAG: hypothetical protein RR716_05965 [Christensenellaceae bacterium]
MLHDPSHITQVPVEKEIVISKEDKAVLRRLGEELKEFAAKDADSDKAELWRALNDLKSKRPMVWINEIPWHEMNVNDELTLQTKTEWAKEQETNLRRTIYQSKHMPGDMIVNPYIECPKIFYSTDFGIVEDVDTVRTDENNEIYSRHFKIQIKDPEDIEKIALPKITYMQKATQYQYEALKDVFDGIMDVKIVGQTHVWYTPWDYLIRWWGISEAMMDLVMRPQMVHDAYERMVNAWMSEMDQFEQQNLLSLDNNNTRIGSGGYGYVSDLPGKDFDAQHVKAHNMWGCANAQIFSSVSPQMHDEFAVQHDLKWLRRFGLTYYGCCEPLDKKMDIMRKIPNLRKISVSAWCDIDRITSEVGKDYVMSRKPSPAIFSGDNFDATVAKKHLTDFLDKAKDGHVELIMKDISTVNYKPQNLWEWEKIAMQVAMDYAK